MEQAKKWWDVSRNGSHTYIVLYEFGPLCKLECTESLTSTAANTGRGLIPNHERLVSHIFLVESHQEKYRLQTLPARRADGCYDGSFRVTSQRILHEELISLPKQISTN